MGPECRHHLVPQPRDHRPASDQGEALVRALVEQRWLPPRLTPEYARTAFERAEARLTWDVEHLGRSGLRYPFVGDPPAGDDTAYTVEIHVADDYVYAASELMDPFDDTACACGTELEYDPPGNDAFRAGRLRRICPACRRPFDPGERKAAGRDPWTGAAILVPGGLCYRFAIVLVAGKGVPSTRRLQVHPELRSLCQRVLGVRLADVGTRD